MTALPAFAGTVTGPDLLAKLDAMTVEVEARTAAANARASALEAFVQRQTGGYGLGPVSDAGVFTYSAKPAWVSATRKGRASIAAAGTIGSWFDPDGRATVTRLADLAGGATRFVAVTWNSAGMVGSSSAITVTVLDIAADGSVTIVRQISGQGIGSFGENTSVLVYLGTAQVVRISDTMFKVRAIYRVDNSNTYTYGINTIYTYVLNTDGGANTLTAQSKELDVGNYRVITSQPPLPAYLQNCNYSGFYRRRAWAVGSYGIVWPSPMPSMDASYTSRVVPGALIGDRIGGSPLLDARGFAPSFSSTWTMCVERVGGASFATLTEGPVAGRTTPALGAKVSVVGIDDAFAGVLGSVSIPVAVSGNGRLQPLSATAFVAGWTSGSQFSSYLVARDPATGVLTWRGAADATGALGAVWAESHAFSATKLAVWTVSAGWTFNLTTVAVDSTVAPGGASPFTQVGQVQVNLCQSVAGAVAGDTVILGAVERVGPDRVLTIARNATRGGCDIEVWDLA